MDPHHIARQILAVAWPKIAEINWAAMASEIRPFDDDGLPKFTGIVAHIHEPGMVMAANTQVLGAMFRVQAAGIALMRQFRRLEEDPRLNFDPIDLGVIRSDLETETIVGVIGLPKVANHVLVAQIMKKSGLLSPLAWDSYGSVDEHAVMAALRDDGFDFATYKTLQAEIDSIVSAARDVVFQTLKVRQIA